MRRFEREMSVSSTDSGVSVNSPHIPIPTTSENGCTAETAAKQSKIPFSMTPEMTLLTVLISSPPLKNALNAIRCIVKIVKGSRIWHYVRLRSY